MKKRVVFLLVLSLALLAAVSFLSACGGTSGTTATTTAATTGTSATGGTTATTGGTPGTTAAPAAGAAKVTVAIAADPGDLGPFVGMSNGRIAVLNTMYEYLISGDSKVIAESFEASADGTSATVKIRANVKDSAGNAVTAADVAFCYTTAVAAGTLSPLGPVQTVTAADDSTVQFKFKNALNGHDIEDIIGEVPIVSQKAYEASSDKFATKPISTAAYMVTENVPGSTLTFAKNPNYWQTDATQKSPFATANVDKIVFQVITEPSQHSVALETGKADISASVAGTDVPRFKDNPKFNYKAVLDNLTQVLSFNGSTGGAFTNLDLRQAVAYSVDKDAVGKAAAGENGYTAAHTIGNHNFNGYLEKWNTQPYYPLDATKAKSLFGSSGAKAGMTAKLLCQSDPRSGLMAQVIQSELADLGITVKINAVEPAVYNTLKYDPTAWDLILDATAGGDQVYSPWNLLYSKDSYNGTTSNWFKDDQLQALLAAAAAPNGQTEANLDAFVNYDRDHVYSLGLLSWQFNFVSVKAITKIFTDDRNQIIPGACEYDATFGK